MMAAPVKSDASHFYKYAQCSDAKHLERLKRIILKHELYFPRLSQMNDPADGRRRLALLSDDQLTTFLLNDYVRRNPHFAPDVIQRERLKLQMHFLENRIQDTHRLIAEQSFLDYRIYSLSKRLDNMSLWAKYGADHSGYCLEFANQGLFADAWEVRYGGTTPMNMMDPNDREGHYLFYKSSDWSNEEEVRILLHPVEHDPIVRFDLHLLRSIILGKDMTKSNKAAILEWAQQRNLPLDVASATYDELQQAIRVSS